MLCICLPLYLPRSGVLGPLDLRLAVPTGQQTLLYGLPNSVRTAPLLYLGNQVQGKTNLFITLFHVRRNPLHCVCIAVNSEEMPGGFPLELPCLDPFGRPGEE